MFDLATKEGQCYLWDETVAKRGSNEIGSGLIKYMHENQRAKKIWMISDACGGQTRNRFVAMLCIYLVQTMENVEEIDHMFMVSGHSHMEVDSMHARIERKSESLNINVPDDWAIVASIARNNPYIVKFLEQKDVKDLKKLYEEMKVSNVTKNTEGERVHWTTSATNSYGSDDIVAWMHYEKKSPGILFYKTCYDEGAPFKQIRVFPRKLRNFDSLTLKQAYNKPIPLEKKKLDDLLKLCDDGAIPERCHYFYKSLYSMTTDTVAEDDE